MNSRHEQVSQVILRAFNDFLIKEAELPRDSMATVTKVAATNDLKTAFISLSILPINRAGTVLNFINRHLGEAARYLGRRLKLRLVPKLVLRIDDSELKYRKVERELEKIEE